MKKVIKCKPLRLSTYLIGLLVYLFFIFMLPLDIIPGKLVNKKVAVTKTVSKSVTITKTVDT